MNTPSELTAAGTAPRTPLPPQAQLLALFPPPLRETIRRCAVPRTFGLALYEAHLRAPHDGGPELNLLVQLGQVEAVPGRTDRYRLRSEVSEAALLDWWGDEGRPPALELPVPARLCEIAASVRAADESNVSRLEKLAVELLHDPKTAGETFVTLYTEADGAHDLARCRAVLDVLDAPDRLPLLTAGLADLRNKYATYLAARTLWVDDYYRSAHYVSRPHAERALEQMLSPDGSRILQLYARGGMGKSMQLRWFTARRAVPHRIPCARVDFDNVHSQVAARLPWLLLLELAAQLNRQLVGGPFQELLAAHGRYRALLPVAPGPGEVEAAPQHAAADDGEDVVARFCAIVQELDRARPVVLILDTVEEILRPSVNPAGLVRLLGQITRDAPTLRIVLAGRYDLREPDRPTSGLEMTSLQLKPLTDAEQRTYLTGIRGITDRDLIDAIQWLCRGLPLTLSLYANLVTEAQSITAAELRGCDDPGLLSAVNRVVKRLDDHRVRWLLRYGVIPRRLSFEFVRSVMWPYLREGMTGQSTVDAPTADRRPHDPDRPIFRTDISPPRDDAELQEVWDALLTYAADYGWVSVERDGAVQFRSDLQEPLRALIQPHDVFRHLQRDAAEFFAAKALSAPAEWLRWTREAIFHRIFVDVEAGAQEWRRAMAHAASARRNDWCLDLASNLLGREFTDWDGEPIPPMTHELLANAQLELARAAASVAEERALRDEDAAAGNEDPLWNDVERSLVAAVDLARRAGVILPGVAVLDARLSLARGDAERASKVLWEHRKELEPSRDLADLERTLGRALHRLRRPGAADRLSASFEIACEAGDLAGAQLSLLLAVDRYEQVNRYTEAINALRTARDRGAAGAADEVDDVFAFVEASILARAGQPEQARVRAREMIERTDSVAAHHAMALAAYFAENPLVAVDSCTDARRRQREDASSDQSRTEAVLGLRGHAWAQVHAYDRAVGDLMAAASLARARRNPDRAADHAAEAALILLRGTSDLRQASQCLDEAERSAPAIGSRGWAKVAFGWSRLMCELREFGVATESLVNTRRTLADVGAPPDLRIRAALAALALPPTVGSDAHRDALTELVEQLRLVTPAAARWWMLSDLKFAGSLVAVDRSLCREVVALAWLRDDAANVTELAAQGWRLAEALRVTEDHRGARSVLDRALRHRGGDLLGWWRWLDAVSRLGDAQPDEPTPPDDLIAGAHRTPTLAAACLILLARRRLLIDPPQRIQHRLDMAAELLDRPGRPTVWAAHLALARAELDRRLDLRPAASRHAAEAAGLLSRLGATVERDAVADRYVLGGSPARDEGRAVEIHLGRPRDETMEITVRRPGEQEVVHVASLKDVGGLSFQNTHARIRHVLGPLAKGWRTWSTQIAERVLVPELRQLAAASRDLRIVAASRELAAWPWELTRAHGMDAPLACASNVGLVYRSLSATRRTEAMVRALQGALDRLGYFDGVADGLIGAMTMDALRKFQSDAGIDDEGITSRDTWAALRERLAALRQRMPNVVLLRPDPERELEKQRGSKASGTSLIASYLRAGFTVDVLDNPTLRGVHRFVSAGDRPMPDLVHVVAPVRYSGGATVLDLSDDAGARSVRSGGVVGELTVTRFSELLAMLARGGRVPLVVLDVPLPSSQVEALRSLSVRNSIAHQVLQLGQVDVILATGLADQHDRPQLTSVITEGLGRGDSAAKVLATMHAARTGSDAIGSVLAFLGSALFTDRPPFALLPLG